MMTNRSPVFHDRARGSTFSYKSRYGRRNFRKNAPGMRRRLSERHSRNAPYRGWLVSSLYYLLLSPTLLQKYTHTHTHGGISFGNYLRRREFSADGQ